MTDKPRRRFGPGKGELQIWLALSLAGFALMATVIATHGWPEGPGLFEVVFAPGALLAWLFLRSVVRLARGDYPPG